MYRPLGRQGSSSGSGIAASLRMYQSGTSRSRPAVSLRRGGFVFDHDRNVYICPAGAELHTFSIIDQGRILPYRASTTDCSICALKPQCTTAASRKVSRDIDKGAVCADGVRALANTEAFQVSRRERKKVEMEFPQHEAHPQARPAAPARFVGCQRRGAAHRDGAEPEAARRLPLPSPTTGHRRMCSVDVQCRQAFGPDASPPPPKKMAGGTARAGQNSTLSRTIEVMRVLQRIPDNNGQTTDLV